MEIEPVVRGHFLGTGEQFFEILGPDAGSSGKEVPLLLTDRLGLFLDSRTDQKGIQLLMGFEEGPGDAGEHDFGDTFVESSDFEFHHGIEFCLFQPNDIQFFDIFQRKLIHGLDKAELRNYEIEDSSSHCSR